MGEEVSRGDADSVVLLLTDRGFPLRIGMTTQRFAFIALLGCVLPSTALTQAPAAGSASDPSLIQRMLDAEDARTRDSSALAPLLAGLRSPDVATRRAAARGIGRMERLENIPAL